MTGDLMSGRRLIKRECSLREHGCANEADAAGNREERRRERERGRLTAASEAVSDAVPGVGKDVLLEG